MFKRALLMKYYYIELCIFVIFDLSDKQSDLFFISRDCNSQKVVFIDLCRYTSSFEIKVMLVWKDIKQEITEVILVKVYVL